MFIFLIVLAVLYYLVSFCLWGAMLPLAGMTTDGGNYVPFMLYMTLGPVLCVFWPLILVAAVVGDSFEKRKKSR